MTKPSAALQDRIIRLYRKGYTRREIAGMVGRCYESVSAAVRHVPDNGTTGRTASGALNQDRATGFPVPTDKPENKLASVVYGKPKPGSTAPKVMMQGDRLKFAAAERNRPWGVAQYG